MLDPDESAGEASLLVPVAEVAVVGVLLTSALLPLPVPATASSTEVFSTLPVPL